MIHKHGTVPRLKQSILFCGVDMGRLNAPIRVLAARGIEVDSAHDAPRSLNNFDGRVVFNLARSLVDQLMTCQLFDCCAHS